MYFDCYTDIIDQSKPFVTSNKCNLRHKKKTNLLLLIPARVQQAQICLYTVCVQKQLHKPLKSFFFVSNMKNILLKEVLFF